ncbi:DUF7535 family protein [Halobaculum gomorrense]|uniref:Uncharacterized protein n=1 Tax=Halobaculum gomorrense TaxID=43928 RepID=A0A1M5JV02_9EURY|nr:hypothetical protein [Halobaculum gomorrense]SHG44374.1 hypothetical protein SAMN05443636_0276 [Halobaculum gomorrense]
MSTEIDTTDTDDDAGLLTTAYRTVTPGYRSHSDDEMNTIGWAMFLGLLAILLSLLPFIAIVWGVSKVIEAITGDGEAEE